MRIRSGLELLGVEAMAVDRQPPVSLSPLPRVPAGPERRGAALAGRRCASTSGESRGAPAGGGLQIGGFRAYRVNPNPNFRVPEMSGIDFSEQISGSISENPNFRKPEITDPNFSGNPNAHP